MKRCSEVLLAVVLAAAVTGCAATAPDAVTTAPPGVGTTDRQVPADSATVLFRVDPAPSLLVPLLAAFAAPTVTVYRDGTVVRQAPDSSSGSRPPQWVTGRAAPGPLAAFVAELESWDRPLDDAAFGIPTVTDLASTRILLHTDGTTATVDVYGFQPGLDRYVDDAARTERAVLRGLVDQASALLPSGEPYVPTAVRAVDVGPADPNTDAPDWPGPSPQTFEPGRFLGFACLVIGESADGLLRAAAANASAVWTTSSGYRTIAVTPVLPGQASCT